MGNVAAAMASASPPQAPVTDSSGRLPLLFVIADTGGGHRAAAAAVTDALEERYPGRFQPVLCNPLDGPDSSRLLRWVTGLYGPSIRIAPWTWGVIYYSSDSKMAMAFLRRSLLALANRPLRAAVAEQQPAAIVSFHPLVGAAAAKARRASLGGEPPLIAVITDLVTPHTAWRYDKVDEWVVPSAAVRWACHLDRIPLDRCHEVGLPVGAAFPNGPARPLMGSMDRSRPHARPEIRIAAPYERRRRPALTPGCNDR